MDCKYTRQTVRISAPMLKQTAEHPVDATVTLPDSCSDIKRLLKCRVKPCVISKTVKGDMFCVEGEVALSICYVDREGCIKSYDHTEAFAHDFELPSPVDEAVSQVTLKVSYMNCKAINERRVDIHSSLAIQVCVKACVPMDIVTDIDEPTVRQLRGSRPSSTLVGFDEKYLIVSDEMSVGDTSESIRSILRTDSRVLINDTKMIGSKVVVKGEMRVKLLYIGEEEGECCSATESFPFSQIFDVVGLNENCTCSVDASVIGCEVRPHTDMSGMLRKAMVGAKLYLSVTAYCNAQIPYLTDAYSTERKLEIGREPLTLERVAHSVNEPFVVTKRLDVPVESIDKVLDVWNDVELGSVNCTDGTIVIKGTLQVSILALDSSKEALYFERGVEFEFTRDVPENAADGECQCSLTPTDIVYSLGRGDFEIKSELNVRADLIERSYCDVITSAELGERQVSKYSNSSVVIYRAGAGERLWDIAKNYNTSVEAIAELNSVSGEEIEVDRTVVIPVGSV